MLQFHTSRDQVPLAASRRFGHFKPEEERAVRSLIVTGDELDVLRAKREMIRKMTPDQALSVIEFHENLTFFEAVALAKKEGKIIVPHDVIDRILTETKEKFSGRTGTLIIHEAPNKPFGKQITCDGISFTIPEQFKGKSNCALAIDYPDFGITLLKKGYRLKVPDETKIYLISEFPAKDGWYMPHKETKIPHGRKVDQSTEARYLYRLNNSSYVGLRVRYGDGHDYWGRGVDANCGASDRLGVALF